MKKNRSASVTLPEPPPAVANSVAGPAAAGRRMPACFASALCCAVLFCVMVHLSPSTIRVPFTFAGDALVGLSIAKNVAGGNWWWQNPRLAAPNGADWRDFPLHMHTEYGAMRLFGLVSSDPVVIMNLFWALAVTCTAGFATYSLLRLGVDRVIAAGIGVVYALQPFTYYRNTGHFNLIFYFVPLLAGFAVELASKGAEESGDPGGRFAFLRRVPAYVWIAAVLQGLSYAYNSFFSCFVMLTAAIFAAALRRKLSAAAPFLAVIAVVATFFTVNHLPSLVYWRNHGKNTAMIQKSAREVEFYGLKLRHLITPVPNHKIPLFSKFAIALDDIKFPSDNENSGSRLGLLGTVGFLYLLGLAVLGPVLRALARPPSGAAPTLAWLSTLNVSAFLFATIGGFGSFFSALVVPDFRCLNRIVVYISYFSLCAVGLLLTSAKLRCRARKVWPVNVAISAILLLAVVDQDYAGGLRRHDLRAPAFAQARAFAQSVEARFEKGARVFQLPYTGFPVDERPNGIDAYQHALPYVLTSSLRFSWGAVPGRDAAWYIRAAGLPAKNMADELKRRGFSAIWIDTRGYPGLANSPVPDFGNLLGPATLVDPGGSIYVFDLRPYAAQPVSAESLDENFAMRLCRNLLGRQFSADERRTAVAEIRQSGRAEFVRRFLESKQFREAGVFTGAAYLGVLGRPPDFEGWQYWTATVARNPQQAQLALVEEFLRSPEGRGRFAGNAETSLLSISRSVLGKPVDAGTFETWRQRLNTGQWSFQAAARSVLASPQLMEAAQKRLLATFVYFGVVGKTPPEAEEKALRAQMEAGGGIAGLMEAIENQYALP